MSPVRTRGRSSAAATCPSRERMAVTSTARAAPECCGRPRIRGLDPPFEAPRRARLWLHMVEVSVRTHWMACTATQGASAASARRVRLRVGRGSLLLRARAR